MKNSLSVAKLSELHRRDNATESIHGRRGGDYIRDVVFSANDGLVTTFAVVAGVAGARLSPSIVVILGLANMFADGLAMALGNYLGTKSRVEFEHKNRQLEEMEVDAVPNHEREEVRAIAERRGIPAPRIAEWVTTITSSKRIWVDEMMVWELGIVPGETASPVKNALATLCAFVVAGFLPLIPYVFRLPGDLFLTSVVLTATALFGVGALRTAVTKRRWTRSGAEMLLVGGVAAAVAYLVGAFIGRLVA